jgi:hypothetical protein
MKNLRTVKLALTAGAIEITGEPLRSGRGSRNDGCRLPEGRSARSALTISIIGLLSTADEPDVSFEFKDSEECAQLRTQPPSEYNYRYVVMPDENLIPTTSRLFGFINPNIIDTWLWRRTKVSCRKRARFC